MSITNSTFTSNWANGTDSDAGGGLYTSGTMNLFGSIVANNSKGNCIIAPGGLLTDQGSNLESGMDCGLTGRGSLQNTDPKFDPNGLQDNGGPSQTITLALDSPASEKAVQTTRDNTFQISARCGGRNDELQLTEA